MGLPDLRLENDRCGFFATIRKTYTMNEGEQKSLQEDGLLQPLSPEDEDELDRILDEEDIE